jgi:hypothetical protein
LATGLPVVFHLTKARLTDLTHANASVVSDGENLDTFINVP